MKRKVVKHGPSTLIVSLPVKWTRKLNVQPGDELEVQENGKDIIVSTDIKLKPKKAELDLTGMDRTSIVQQIRDLYRKGYSEIKVSFKENKAYHLRTGKDVAISSVVHDEVNNLIGMEIISQKNDFCLIKELTESSGKEFDNLLRKIFFQLNEVFDDMIPALENGDFSELSIIEEKHDTITKFISYCIHLLNEGKTEGVEGIGQLHQLLVSIEFIIDILKYFSRSVISTNHKFKKASINVVRGISELFEKYSKLQLKFKKELITELPKKRNDIKNQIDDLLLKKDNLQDMAFINYLASIVEVIKSMWEIKLSSNELVS